MKVVSDVWSHTFGLNLTFLINLKVRPQQTCQSLSTSELRSICAGFSPLIDALQTMDRTLVYKLNTTISLVFGILHDTVSQAPHNRSRRAWFPFVSEIFRTVFGFSTERMVESVQQLIIDVQKSTAGVIDRVSVHADKLASFMQLSNERFQKLQQLVNTQQQTFASFVSQYKSDYHEMQIAHLLIAQALQRSTDFTLHIGYIQNFEQAVLLGMHGQ